MPQPARPRLVAYRTANHPDSRVKGSLPDDFICEWTHLDLQPEGFQHVSVQSGESHPDYWSVMSEDEFLKLWGDETGVLRPGHGGHVNARKLERRR